MYTFLHTASTTDLVGNVVTAVGDNFDAVAIIIGLAAAIPLVFYVARRIVGLFPKGR
jgi:hypothetical protein